jgi:hypothetical protein
LRVPTADGRGGPRRRAFSVPKCGVAAARVVEGGKVVEHWDAIEADAIEAIPPKSEWKNDNGKF